MIANDWEKVEDIFHGAVGLPFAERKPFLRRECGGNVALLAEIESLIESFEDNSKFLKQPVFEYGLGAIHKSIQKDLSGSIIGVYELKEKIGAGGMGEVYKAFDTRLNRFVALKFLSESLKNETAAKRQLVKEAQAAAALEHPNICTVYGFEQTDEHDFIVMQYVEGQTLSENPSPNGVCAAEFKSLARQILTAVAFAHSHGVIHRDLKPGNIMLTADGHIKILDFGLAKIISPEPFSDGGNGVEPSRFSQKGLIIGTVSYMSPEQLRGERLDYRSDIFSLGIVFHKMITGENPFKRQSQAETIAAILNEKTESLENFAPDFPQILLDIVEKCLHKDKNVRFQSVAEILVELDHSTSENRKRARSAYGAGLFIKIAFAAAALLMIMAFTYFYSGNNAQQSIAVLPISLENVPADKEFLADGLTQEFINKLSGLSNLKVKNEYRVAVYKGQTVDPQTAGRQLGVDAVLVGKIQNRVEGLFLITRLIRTSDGFEIDFIEKEIKDFNLIELQENITARLIDKIKSSLTVEDKIKFARNDTDNEEAKLLYFKGRHYLNRRASGDINNAINSFTLAKELDPGFTKAWTGLADSYILMSLPGAEKAVAPEEAARLSKFVANKALEINDNISETYNSLGMITLKYEWDWKKAENYFKEAIRLNPEFAPARVGLISVLNLQGRFAESFEEVARIREIDPESGLWDIELAKIHYRKGEYEQMEKTLSDLLSRLPNNRRISSTQTYLFLKTGRYTEAIAILEKIYQSEKISDKVYAAAPLGFAYAKTERRAEALEIIENLERIADKHYVPAQETAIIYIGLGNIDKAFEYLNKSCEERFSTLPALINDPLIEEIKSDARFEDIKECTNLAE